MRFWTAAYSIARLQGGRTNTSPPFVVYLFFKDISYRYFLLLLYLFCLTRVPKSYLLQIKNTMLKVAFLRVGSF